MIDHREEEPVRGEAEDGCDPDIAVLTDYVMGELSTADAEQFEQRLREEDGLLDRLWPALRIYYGNGPDIFLAVMRDRYPDEAAAVDAAVSAAGIAPRPRVYPRFEKFLPPAWAPAALTAGQPSSKNDRKTWRRPSWLNIELGQLAGYMAAAGVVIAALAGGGAYAYRNVDRIETARTAWMLAHRGVYNDARYQIGVNFPEMFQVVLAPGSRIRGEPAGWSTGYALMLEGSATVKMTDNSRLMWFMTAAGEVSLMPDGEYQITTEDSTAMRVTVKRGSALVRGGGTKDENDARWITVGAGQEARVTRVTK